MDLIYDLLTMNKQPVNHWYYGHFHQSWNSSIGGILLRCWIFWNLRSFDKDLSIFHLGEEEGVAGDDDTRLGDILRRMA